MTGRTFSLGRQTPFPRAASARPLHQINRHTTARLARLGRLFHRLDPLMFRALAVLTAGFALLWHQLFQVYADSVAPDLGHQGMIESEGGSSWFLLAFAMGLLSAFPARARFMRYLLGHRYGVFRRFRNLRAGFDLRLGYAGAVAVVLPIVSYAAYADAHSYTAFTDDRVVVQRPWAAAISQPYREIMEIRADEAVQVDGQAHFEIEFYDGTIVRTDENLAANCSCSVPSGAIFASSMSGRQITNWERVKPKDWPESCPQAM